MDIKLSIVIPVYNVERYIAQCLDSLLQQDLEEDSYEVILVDDGSTDGSAAVCNDYVKRYPDVFHLISQPNGGVSSARNTGLRAAKGEFVTFVDSDDWVARGGYRYIFDSIDSDKSDKVLFYSVTLDKIELSKHSYDGYKVKPATRPIIYTTGLAFLEERYNFSVCNVLWRRSFLLSHNLFFEQGLVIGEDVFYNVKVDLQNPRITIVPTVIYMYMVREGSAVNNLSSEDHLRRAINGYMRIAERVCALADDYAESKPRIARTLREKVVGGSVALPMTSRILSSRLTVKEFKHLRNKLQTLGVLPLSKEGGRQATAINYLFATPSVLKLCQWLYRAIFIPFVKPRLSRN